MILESLTKQYDALAAKGRITEKGWSQAKVSLVAELTPDGKLRSLIPVTQNDGGKERPIQMKVPEQVKKTSGIASNFLCDNATYFFGIDTKGKPERALNSFHAAVELHHEILKDAASPAAQSVISFFDNWDAENANDNQILQKESGIIESGGNIVFRVNGIYAQDDPEIRERWMRYKNSRESEGRAGICLVTGEYLPIARLHYSIKGIVGAQSSGASLVSYNAPAFESYGHEQGDNAPVSESAMFRYTTVLNYMLTERKYVERIGETTVFFWSEYADERQQDIVAYDLFGKPPENASLTEEDIKGVLRSVSRGEETALKEMDISPTDRFYLLGISPNAARLSVRFFLENSFGSLLRNLETHQSRLQIARPSWEEDSRLSIWQMMNETANQKSSSKTPPSPVTGAVVLSIINGTSYPISLYEQVLLRIRAERELNWRKAAIIKAYLLASKTTKVPKEVMQVELNKSSNYSPYVLGQLFAMLEKLQEDSQGRSLNTTIKDKYFTSACTTPAKIFPILMGLSSHHQKKLSEGAKVYYDKELTALLNKLEESFPVRLNLEEQGAFYLGYYHKRQSFFEKKVTEEQN